MTNSMLLSLFGKDAPGFPAFRSLQREVDRVFDQYRDFLPGVTANGDLDENGDLVPKIDVRETDKLFEISAELPGVDEEDMNVSVSGNLLTLRGEKSSSHEEDEEGYRLVERSFGRFSRTIPFSFDLDGDKVAADFDKGVLSIKIEKPPEIAAKSKKIEISKAT